MTLTQTDTKVEATIASKSTQKYSMIAVYVVTSKLYNFDLSSLTYTNPISSMAKHSGRDRMLSPNVHTNSPVVLNTEM